MQQFVGVDRATQRARGCVVTPAGLVIDEELDTGGRERPGAAHRAPGIRDAC